MLFVGVSIILIYYIILILILLSFVFSLVNFVLTFVKVILCDFQSYDFKQNLSFCVLVLKDYS